MPQISGIHYASQENTKNLMINGSLDHWQRGTSFNDPVAFTGYTADRWAPFQSNASVTVSRQSAFAGSSFAMRVLSNAAGAFRGMASCWHSGLTQFVYGKYVTYSVYVRRNSTFNVGLTIAIDKNSTPNTTSGGTWVSLVNTTISNANISTTNWTRVSVTALVPGDGTAQGLRFSINVDNGATASGGYYEFAQVMVNTGRVAADYKPAFDSVADEGEACKYFYEQKFTLNSAWVTTATVMNFGLKFVRKRVNPTIAANGTITMNYGPGGSQSASGIITVINSLDEALMNASNAGGMTADGGGQVYGTFNIDSELV